jgi:hypothetical protein
VSDANVDIPEGLGHAKIDWRACVVTELDRRHGAEGMHAFDLSLD